MKQVLTLKSGYRQETEFEEFTYDKILHEGYKFVKAIKRSGETVLCADYILCPYCGNKMYLRGDDIYHDDTHDDEDLLEWADNQVSFFGDECEEIPLARRVVCRGNVSCSQCKRILKRDAGDRRVEFNVNGGKLTVKSRFCGIGELLDAKIWKGSTVVCFSPKLCEVLTFNMKKGRVHISLCDDERVYVTRDVTQRPEKLEGTLSERLCLDYTVFKDALFDLFGMMAGRALSKNVGFSALVLNTRYIGYSAEFFDYIPFLKGELEIHPLFKKRETMLHRADDLPKIFENSRLPKRKALRRILFSNPGYFFYLDEIYKIYEMLDNYDVFIRFISNPKAFKFFSLLNRFPRMEEYLKLIFRINPSSRVRAVFANIDEVYTRALEYASMSDAMKRRMEKALQTKDGQLLFETVSSRASLPVISNQHMKDSEFNGYTFHPLRNTNEYARAGKELSNCLNTGAAEWMQVVGVLKDGRYVAAMEIRGDKVVQIRGYRNCSIETPPLVSAIEKWGERFAMKLVAEEDPFDFLEDLPF